jgi:GNAT superfamily N-acetyltransferase
MNYPEERESAKPPEVAPEAAASPAFRWVPVRSLAARHRPRILAHLLGLDTTDRYLRFGYVASDAQVGHYVDLLDFERDEVFGVFNRRLELVAMAHLAYLGTGNGADLAAEFGVSVGRQARGRGIGARLFEHAILHARNRHVDTLMVHALSENVPMLRMARSAGATVVRDGADSDAHLKLAHEDIASRIEALLEGGAAEIDYSLKQQAHRIGGLLGTRSEGAPHQGDAGRPSAE